jgi:hypothetical protein
LRAGTPSLPICHRGKYWLIQLKYLNKKKNRYNPLKIAALVRLFISNSNHGPLDFEWLHLGAANERTIARPWLFPGGIYEVAYQLKSLLIEVDVKLPVVVMSCAP